MQYISTVLVATLTPLFAVLVISFLAGINYCRSRGDESSFKFSSWLVFVLSFYVFVGVSSTLFQYFKCEEYALPNGDSRTFLVADLQVDCDSRRYILFMPFVIVMILIYPVGSKFEYAICIPRTFLRDISRFFSLVRTNSPSVLSRCVPPAPYHPER